MTEKETRTVPMSDEQYHALRSTFIADTMPEQLGKVFVAALTQMVKEQETSWDSIYQALGVDRKRDAVVINWIDRSFVITREARTDDIWRRVDARADLIQGLVEAACEVLSRVVGNAYYGNPEQKEPTTVPDAHIARDGEPIT